MQVASHLLYEAKSGTENSCQKYQIFGDISLYARIPLFLLTSFFLSY